MTFVVLSTLFGIIVEERLLVEGGHQQRDVGCTNGVGRWDEWDLGDKGVLSHCQDEPKVAVLNPTTGTLDQCCVHG